MSFNNPFAGRIEVSKTPEQEKEHVHERAQEHSESEPYGKDFDARLDELEKSTEKKNTPGGPGDNPPRDDGQNDKEKKNLIERKEPVTSIDGKIRDIPKQQLPENDANNFKDGKYRAVEATEDITAYRVFGHKVGKQGGYLTTQLPMDRMDSRLNLALLPEWKNPREQYCEVKIPKGTKFNIGLVGEKTTKEGYELPGGAEQILVSEEFVKDASHYGEGKPLGFYSHFSDFDKKLDKLGL